MAQNQGVMTNNIESKYDCLSKIYDCLYLSSVAPTCNEALLQEYKITAILSVLSKKPADFIHFPGIQYHLVQLDDEEQVDLLSHLERTSLLLDKWLNENGHTGVLVHCLMGVSRSSSVVIAYLMKSLQKRNYDEVLEMVLKERPVACPNRGFARQLRLWGHLKFRISFEDEWYRCYFFANIVHSMQKELQSLKNQQFTPYGDLKDRIEQLVDVKNAPLSPFSYRCRRCRCQLFTNVQLIHVDARNYSVHILAWMTCPSAGYYQQSGKITCPKCTAKLGRFSWTPPLMELHFLIECNNGQQNCDLKMPMIFQMHKSAVDVSQSKLMISKLTETTAQST